MMKPVLGCYTGNGVLSAPSLGLKLVLLFVAMMLLLALVFSPVVILSSHGPGAVYLAQQAHVAQQFHGHSHTEDSAGQHDATDHEHPVSAILAGSEKFGFDMHSAVLFHDMPLADVRSRDGPRRPPRVVLI